MSLLLIFGCILVGGLSGFFIPFIIAQFYPKSGTALSFVPMLTVPIGLVMGLIGGILWVVLR